MAKRIGRRFFLNTTSGLALGLPFLPSLLPRTLSAQPAVAPKRFVSILSCSGQMVNDFWPTYAPTGYQLRDTIYGGERSDGTTALRDVMPGSRAKWAPLSDWAGRGLSTVLTSELDPYLDKMLLLRGVDLLQGTSHGNGMILGNYADCASGDEFSSRGLGHIPSIDQVLAYSDRFYPVPPRVRSLALSTGSPGTISYSDYGVAGGSVEQMSGYLDPHDLWQDLFGDFMSPDMPMENPNRSLVNAVYEDYARLRGHRRMSADDCATLERHMTFLDDIERELAAGVSAACVRPDEPPRISGLDYPWAEVDSVESFQQAVDLLVDISVAAIRCDMTRIATFTAQMAVTDALGRLAVSYHNSDDVAGDWHDFAHDAADDPNDLEHLRALNRWVATRVFGRYLQQLDVEEADGQTFLDNSLVYLGAELAMDHYLIGLPTVLAGGAGGALRTGYYVDYTQLDASYANSILPWGVLIPGVPHNRLLVTILQAMGLSPADYERDGHAGYGHIESFSNPWAWPADAYDMTQIGQPLPGIYMG